MGSGQSTGGVGSSRGATSTGSTTSPDVEQVTPPFDAVARPVAAQLGQAVEAIPDHTACLREIGESGYEKAPRYKPRRHDSEQFKIRTYVGKDDKPIVAVHSRRNVPASDQALAKLAHCCDRMFGGYKYTRELNGAADTILYNEFRKQDMMIRTEILDLMTS